MDDYTPYSESFDSKSSYSIVCGVHTCRRFQLQQMEELLIVMIDSYIIETNYSVKAIAER